MKDEETREVKTPLSVSIPPSSDAKAKTDLKELDKVLEDVNETEKVKEIELADLTDSKLAGVKKEINDEAFKKTLNLSQEAKDDAQQQLSNKQ